jgi:hypothetical protein
MKEDLLGADASVRWAVSNLPSFEQRLKAWVRDNIDVVVKELPSDPEKDAIIAIEKSPLPRLFSAEAGAYLNSIRAGLDILAVCIGARVGMPNPDKTYFPIVASEAHFLSLKGYKGADLIHALSAQYRKIVVEKIKPYKGGNARLYALHQLDIARKHRRLLTVAARPQKFTYGASRVRDGDIIPLRDKTLSQRTQNETLLAHITKGAKKHEINTAFAVCFSEPDLGYPFPAIEAIKLFAEAVDAAIQAFDF